MKSFNIRSDKSIVCAMIGYDDALTTIREGRLAEADGSQGLTVGIERLRPEFRNENEFRKIINAFVLPVMFHYYRCDSWLENPPDDDSRAKTLVEAAKAGAGMIDVMGDLFDKSPDERTLNKDAIAKQKSLIDEIHALGSKVIMSSHPCRFMTESEVVTQLRDFEERGADVVKIVTMANTEAEFAETIKTTMALNHELHTPFVHLSGGRFGYAHRMFGLSLGIAISFTLTDYNGWHGAQASNPLIRNMRSVQDNMIWNFNALPETW